MGRIGIVSVSCRFRGKGYHELEGIRDLDYYPWAAARPLVYYSDVILTEGRLATNIWYTISSMYVGCNIFQGDNKNRMDTPLCFRAI